MERDGVWNTCLRDDGMVCLVTESAGGALADRVELLATPGDLRGSDGASRHAATDKTVSALMDYVALICDRQDQLNNLQLAARGLCDMRNVEAHFSGKRPAVAR